MVLTDPITLRQDAKMQLEWTPLQEDEKAKFKGADESTDMTSWNFNIWNLNDNELMRLGHLIFIEMGFNEGMKVDITKMAKWMLAVEAIMNRNNNDYHCFHHVVDVMHSTYLMLSTFEAKALLNDLECFSVLTGALVHDLDHPGTNNTYHSNKGTPLSIVYNDTSILESYHCARTFELFSKSDYDVLSCLDTAQRKEARRIILMSIMATDMVQHFAMKADLDKLVTKLNTTPLEAGVLPEAKERDLVLRVILHGADVSNPSKKWDVCKKWSDHVIAEFFAQGDMEKEEGLPVSMNCDRVTTFQDELSMNFSDFIVGPFYMSINNLLPKALNSTENLKSNRDAWYHMYKLRVDADNTTDENLKTALKKWDDRADGATAAFDACIKANSAKVSG